MILGSDLLIEAALQGLGVALVHRRLAANELSSGELICPFGRYSLYLPQAYWIVSARQRPLSAASARFIEWLLAQSAANT